MNAREHELIATIEALRGALQALVEACPDPLPRKLFWAWADASEILEQTANLPSKIAANSAGGDRG